MSCDQNAGVGTFAHDSADAGQKGASFVGQLVGFEAKFQNEPARRWRKCGQCLAEDVLTMGIARWGSRRGALIGPTTRSVPGGGEIARTRCVLAADASDGSPLRVREQD